MLAEVGRNAQPAPGLNTGEARKYFFFEKKKQKTFAYWLTRCIRLARNEVNKSFLVLFFKKELLPSHFTSFLFQIIP